MRGLHPSIHPSANSNPLPGESGAADAADLWFTEEGESVEVRHWFAEECTGESRAADAADDSLIEECADESRAAAAADDWFAA